MGAASWRTLVRMSVETTLKERIVLLWGRILLTTRAATWPSSSDQWWTPKVTLLWGISCLFCRNVHSGASNAAETKLINAKDAWETSCCKIKNAETAQKVTLRTKMCASHAIFSANNAQAQLHLTVSNVMNLWLWPEIPVSKTISMECICFL